MAEGVPLPEGDTPDVPADDLEFDGFEDAIGIADVPGDDLEPAPVWLDEDDTGVGELHGLESPASAPAEFPGVATPDAGVDLPLGSISWDEPWLAALDAIGVDAAVLDSVPGLWDDDEVLDARRVAAILDASGRDARVEHLDLAGLQQLLDADLEVVVSGSDGTSMLVVAIDDAGGQLLIVRPDAGDQVLAADLDAFVRAWDATANEALLTGAGTGTGAIALATAGYAVLPVTVDAAPSAT